VSFDQGARREAAELLRGSAFDFASEVCELEIQLAASHTDGGVVAHGPDTGSIELISSRIRLVRDPSQVVVDCGDRSRMGPESTQLWVMAVAARGPAQHGTGEQSFPPSRYQAPGVEEGGV